MRANNAGNANPVRPRAMSYSPQSEVTSENALPYTTAPANAEPQDGNYLDIDRMKANARMVCKERFKMYQERQYVHPQGRTEQELFEEVEDEVDYVITTMVGIPADLRDSVVDATFRDDPEILSEVQKLVKAYKAFWRGEPVHMRSDCDEAENPIECCWVEHFLTLTTIRIHEDDVRESFVINKLHNEMTTICAKYCKKHKKTVLQFPRHCQEALWKWRMDRAKLRGVRAGQDIPSNDEVLVLCTQTGLLPENIMKYFQDYGNKIPAQLGPGNSRSSQFGIDQEARNAIRLYALGHMEEKAIDQQDMQRLIQATHNQLKPEQIQAKVLLESFRAKKRKAARPAAQAGIVIREGGRDPLGGHGPPDSQQTRGKKPMQQRSESSDSSPPRKIPRLDPNAGPSRPPSQPRNRPPPQGADSSSSSDSDDDDLDPYPPDSVGDNYRWHPLRSPQPKRKFADVTAYVLDQLKERKLLQQSLRDMYINSLCEPDETSAKDLGAPQRPKRPRHQSDQMLLDRLITDDDTFAELAANVLTDFYFGQKLLQLHDPKRPDLDIDDIQVLLNPPEGSMYIRADPWRELPWAWTTKEYQSDLSSVRQQTPPGSQDSQHAHGRGPSPPPAGGGGGGGHYSQGPGYGPGHSPQGPGYGHPPQSPGSGHGGGQTHFPPAQGSPQQGNPAAADSPTLFISLADLGYLSSSPPTAGSFSSLLRPVSRPLSSIPFSPELLGANLLQHVYKDVDNRVNNVENMEQGLCNVAEMFEYYSGVETDLKGQGNQRSRRPDRGSAPCGENLVCIAPLSPTHLRLSTDPVPPVEHVGDNFDQNFEDEDCMEVDDGLEYSTTGPGPYNAGSDEEQNTSDYYDAVFGGEKNEPQGSPPNANEASSHPAAASPDTYVDIMTVSDSVHEQQGYSNSGGSGDQHPGSSGYQGSRELSPSANSRSQQSSDSEENVSDLRALSPTHVPLASFQDSNTTPEASTEYSSGGQSPESDAGSESDPQSEERPSSRSSGPSARDRAKSNNYGPSTQLRPGHPANGRQVPLGREPSHFSTSSSTGRSSSPSSPSNSAGTHATSPSSPSFRDGRSFRPILVGPDFRPMDLPRAARRLIQDVRSDPARTLREINLGVANIVGEVEVAVMNANPALPPRANRLAPATIGDHEPGTAQFSVQYSTVTEF